MSGNAYTDLFFPTNASRRQNAYDSASRREQKIMARNDPRLISKGGITLEQFARHIPKIMAYNAINNATGRHLPSAFGGRHPDDISRGVSDNEQASIRATPGKLGNAFKNIFTGRIFGRGGFLPRRQSYEERMVSRMSPQERLIHNSLSNANVGRSIVSGYTRRPEEERGWTGYGKAKGTKSVRGAIVAKCMKERGCTLGEASRYVKEHGLY